MKAAQLNKYGGKNSVTINAASMPKIEKDQISVKVDAAGVNPFDVMVREGYTRSMAELNLPATLGGDFAGSIEKVGEEVEGFKVGDTVFGQAGALSGNGSFAEYVPVKASQAAIIRADGNLRDYAALPLAAGSAYQALVTHIYLQPDQTILIHGGAGGIGSMAIQIAKAIGANVITTAASKDLDFVKSLGADEVIDYQKEDFTNKVHDIDAVFDTVGGETNKKSYQAIKNGGSFVSMKDQADEEQVKAKNINYVSQFTTITNKKLHEIANLYESSKLKPQIDKIFKLDDAAEALEYQATGHPKGKVVIQVASL